MNQANDIPVEPVKVLYQKRKPVLIIAAVAAFIAAIFTSPYFVHPVYKSETVVYPPGSNSHRSMIAGALGFGSDKEIDEQIQILKSSEVRDSIIKKYNLIQHYHTDSIPKTQKFKLYKKFEDNVNIDRTRYNSISVIVYDTDPEMAAGIANDIVKFGDAVKNKIIKRNLLIAFDSFSKEITFNMKEIDSLAHRLNELSRENLFPLIPYQRQSDLEKFKNQVAIQDLINKARNENNYTLLEQLFGFENKLIRLSDLQDSYSLTYTDYTSPVPECYIVNRAEASYQKAGPKRTVIVFLTFFATIIISWAWIIIIRKIPIGFSPMK